MKNYFTDYLWNHKVSPISTFQFKFHSLRWKCRQNTVSKEEFHTINISISCCLWVITTSSTRDNYRKIIHENIRNALYSFRFVCLRTFTVRSFKTVYSKNKQVEENTSKDRLTGTWFRILLIHKLHKVIIKREGLYNDEIMRDRNLNESLRGQRVLSVQPS